MHNRKAIKKVVKRREVLAFSVLFIAFFSFIFLSLSSSASAAPVNQVEVEVEVLSPPCDFVEDFGTVNINRSHWNNIGYKVDFGAYNVAPRVGDNINISAYDAMNLKCHGDIAYAAISGVVYHDVENDCGGNPVIYIYNEARNISVAYRHINLSDSITLPQEANVKAGEVLARIDDIGCSTPYFEHIHFTVHRGNTHTDNPLTYNSNDSSEPNQWEFGIPVILNGSFEGQDLAKDFGSDEKKTVNAWFFSNPADGEACAKIGDQITPVAKNQSFLIANRANDENCTSLFQDIEGDFSQGETYNFGIWLRSPSGINREGVISLGEDDAKSITYFSTSSSTEWQCIEASWTVENNATVELRSEIYLHSVDDNDYYFDNAAFTKNEPDRELPACTSFVDIPANHTFYDYIEGWVNRGITTGCDSGDPRWFCPEESLPRDQAMAILGRAFAGINYDQIRNNYLSPFEDVTNDNAFYKWIMYMYFATDTEGNSANIISGYSDGLFHPERYVTRGQWAKMIVQTMKWRGISCEKNPSTAPTFSDLDSDDEFYEYVWCLQEWMLKVDETVGYPSDNTFRSTGTITRAQASKWSSLGIQLVESHEQEEGDSQNNSWWDTTISYYASGFYRQSLSMLSSNMLMAEASTEGKAELFLVTPGDDQDWITLDLDSTETITFSTLENGVNADIKLEIYDNTGEDLLASAEGLARDGGTILTWTPPAVGTYYLKASNTFSYALEGSNYILHASVATSPSDCPSPDTTFCDVPRDHPRYAAIETAYQWGLIGGVMREINGVEYRFFDPEDAVLRRHSPLIVSRWFYGHNSDNYLSILPPLTNVFPADPDMISMGDSETKRAIEMMYRDGVIQGFNDGTFKPEEDTTRASYVIMVMRALYKHQDIMPSYNDSSCNFVDITDPEEKAVVTKACELGLVNGVLEPDGKRYFYPSDPMYRELAAMVACRAFAGTNAASPNECGDNETVPTELLALRSNARETHDSEKLCFTAADYANGEIPNVSISYDGMTTSYNYGIAQYEAGCGSSSAIPPVWVYRDNISSPVCGPYNYVALYMEPNDNYQRARMWVSKCGGGNFLYGGRYDIWMDVNSDGVFDSEDDYDIGNGTYTAGDDRDPENINPVNRGYFGPYNYQGFVYSDDDPDKAKLTGTLRMWEEYIVPDTIAHNQIYATSSDEYECGNLISGRFRAYNDGKTIRVYIGKCDGNVIEQPGVAYIYVDNVPRWGPFPYSAGSHGYILEDIDPYTLGYTGSHTYKVVAYSDDQPTIRNKYSGNVVITNNSAPETPENLQASDDVFTDHVRLTWNDKVGETYEVIRSPINNPQLATTIAQGATGGVYEDASAATGTTYYYWTRACSSVGCSNLSNSDAGSVKDVIPAPANDARAFAITISGNTATKTQTTVGATIATDDPVFSCIGTKGVNTAWYKFTPSEFGELTIDTFGSGFDTVLGVYTSDLANRACNDNFEGSPQSQVSTYAYAGNTYYIEVAGYNEGDMGNLTLNLNFVVPDRTAPTILSSTRRDASPTSLSSVTYDVIFSEDVFGVDTTDFIVTVSGVSGAYVTNVNCSGSACVVAVNTGTGSGTLRLDLRSSGTGIRDIANNYIVGGYTSGQEYTIDRIDPPANDLFGNAIPLDDVRPEENRDTRGATPSNSDPSLAACGISGSGQATVWYTYTPDSNSALSLDTLGSGYDTFIAVWTGSEENLTLVACNNDANSSTVESQLAFQVDVDTTYYIEIGQP